MKRTLTLLAAVLLAFCLPLDPARGGRHVPADQTVNLGGLYG